MTDPFTKRDDSYLQMLIDRGAVGSAGPRRARTRVATSSSRRWTAAPDRSPTVMTHPARVGDRLLLCSDGLSDMLDDDTIRETLNTPSRERCAELLLEWWPSMRARATT